MPAVPWLEHLRRILQSLGITAQRTRTLKWSTDPLYEEKKGWVLAAHKGAEAGTIDGVVVSFDECGPISLKPHAGSQGSKKKEPDRQRATYHHKHGVRKLMGAYDVGANRFWGRLEKEGSPRRSPSSSSRTSVVATRPTPPCTS